MQSEGAPPSRAVFPAAVFPQLALLFSRLSDFIVCLLCFWLYLPNTTDRFVFGLIGIPCIHTPFLFHLVIGILVKTDRRDPGLYIHHLWQEIIV